MGDAFLISFVSVTLAAFIGIYIRNKIWGLSNKPKTPNDYGKAWAAYVAFISIMVSIPRFIHKEFELALIQLLIACLVYPTIAYVVGSLYGLRKFSNQTISKNVVTVQKFFTPPVNAIVGLGNLNQDNKSNFHVKQIVTVFSILIGIVILTFGYAFSIKETYICSGEVISTSSETNKSDKVTKSPIEFGFSWNKADKSLELSSIGILKGISKEIKESYTKDSEKISIWDKLEKKSLGIKAPVSNDKIIEFNKSNFSDYGLELYRFSFDRESHYLVTSQNVSYFINGISHDHKVFAKCSRKWF